MIDLVAKSDLLSSKKINLLTERNTYIILYIFFFIVHMLVSIPSKTPLVYADEFGYIQNARDLINGIIPQNTYYPGYSVFIIPAFLISNNIRIAYIIIHVMNSLMMAFIPVFTYMLINIFDNTLSKNSKIIITILTSFYPPYILYSNFAMSEALFIPLFLLLTLEVYYLTENKINYYGL